MWRHPFLPLAILLGLSQKLESPSRKVMRKSLADCVFVVGPLPPPVHGASVITQKVIELLQSHGVVVVRLNASPAALTRGWRWHASRIRAYLRCYGALLRAPQRATVYLSLSGGNGLGYDLLVAALARLKAHRIILHHHSFNYIDRWRPAFAWLLRAAPLQATHIVLCNEMRARIEQRYRRKINAVLVSNFSFFLDEANRGTPHKRLRRVGFLSNITLDKGIDRFLDVAGQLGALGIEAHIAGPIVTPGLKDYFDERVRRLGNVKYLGPVFGEDKREFYRNIDLFILPSRYINEAEPLVIYEALAAGLPIAVTARGCLCELNDRPYVIVMDRDAADLGPVVARVERWAKDQFLFERASLAALEHMKALHHVLSPQLAALLAAIVPATRQETGEATSGYPDRVAHRNTTTVG